MPEDLELIADIMELRRYARAKARVEAAKTPEQMKALSAWDQDWVMRVQEYNIRKWQAQTSN